MQIGEVIRKYRKEKGMTQEVMADCLGVTAPAVNKWENGNSYPDISLLAPISRLLGITTDTLLSYKENLTDKEAANIIEEISKRLKQEDYDTVFKWAEAKIEEYPNCEYLILWSAQVFTGFLQMSEIPNAEQYEDKIDNMLMRILQSEDEAKRTSAAESLFYSCIKKEEYEKAEEYLNYFSIQNPERNSKQALLYLKQNRLEEAYRLYEQLLFSGYQSISMTLHGLYNVAIQEENVDKARIMIEKQGMLAELFEMGRYHAVASKLELAIFEKNKTQVLAIKKEMLESIEEMNAFCHSKLYEHMEFKEPNEEFLQDVRNNLEKFFEEDEALAFLNE